MPISFDIKTVTDIAVFTVKQSTYIQIENGVNLVISITDNPCNHTPECEHFLMDITKLYHPFEIMKCVG